MVHAMPIGPIPRPITAHQASGTRKIATMTCTIIGGTVSPAPANPPPITPSRPVNT